MLCFLAKPRDPGEAVAEAFTGVPEASPARPSFHVSFIPTGHVVLVRCRLNPMSDPPLHHAYYRSTAWQGLKVAASLPGVFEISFPTR